MLTPDEIRERIRRTRDLEDDGDMLAGVIVLLEDALPDLVALATGRSGQDSQERDDDA